MSGGGPRYADGWGHEHGAHGDTGRRSSELLADELAERQSLRGIFPAKGWRARLRYLDGGPAGAAELARRGLTPSRWQRTAWAAGGRPNKANQARINDAYEALRRQRVVDNLTRRLEKGGAGTRVEIIPSTQQDVDPARRRNLQRREVNVRHWDGIVSAWVNQDDASLDRQWNQVLETIDSDWGAYQYASAVGLL